MPRNPSHVIQSFRLRFWREPRQGASGVWRGDVWHEQQNPGDKASAVASPDEAFALVRNRLYSDGSEHHGSGEDKKNASPLATKRHSGAIWRRLLTNLLP